MRASLLMDMLLRNEFKDFQILRVLSDLHQVLI